MDITLQEVKEKIIELLETSEPEKIFKSMCF